MEDKIRYIQEKIAELKILITEEQAMQLYQYYKILVEKNKVMNLTGITEFEEVVQKHFVDSLTLCRVCDLTLDKKLLDVGTGAGFPGIPLKIIFPQLEITLLDSLNKRVKFLDYVIDEAGAREILLSLESIDFSCILQNEHKGFEQERLYVFGKEVSLLERNGIEETVVPLYIKMNNLETGFVIVISFHRQRHPLTYCFQ